MAGCRPGARLAGPRDTRNLSSSAGRQGGVISGANMNYNKLRDMVSHRVTFEYDTGTKLVGYVASCAPANGPLHLLVLSKVQLLDAAQNVIARYDELPLVPSNLIGFQITEGPL